MIKCIGCQHLYREVINRLKGPVVVYDCWLGRLPYSATLSGLLRPAKGITSGAEKCPEQPTTRCAVCQQTTDLRYYGSDNSVATCQEHDKAWGKWLDKYPERRACLAPRGRLITANWVELFRDFIEEMRR